MRKIKDIGEFGLIGEFAKIFPPSPEIPMGIGDDCAVLKNGKDDLLLTTDALIENIHFMMKYTPPRLLGYKSLAVNLSDIAAMAGEPTAAVFTLGAPPETDLHFITEFARGMQSCARKYGCSLVGGDTTRSEEKIFINIAVIGRCRGKPVYRSGARPGDLVAVAGWLGESTAGLEYLLSISRKRKLKPGNPIFKKRLVRAHLKPEPLLNEALRLKERLKVNSMIDISDGLSSELNHISKNSAVRVMVDADKIPLSAALKRHCGKKGQNALDMAVAGGEDYSLLFTFAERYANELPGLKLDVPVTVIGRVEKGKNVFMRSGMTVLRLPPRSYSHF